MNQPSHSDALNEIAEEILQRLRLGDRPQLAEYTTRFPELADKIRDLFPTLMMVEKFGSPDISGGLPSGEPTQSGLRKIGEYHVLREVGRGGMGIVYEAEQESLGRRVALKVLSAQSRLDPNQVRRFEREARSVARLEHPNIVPMYAIGTSDDIRYLAMKFIAGRGLDEVVNEVRLHRQRGVEFIGANGPAMTAPLSEVTTALLGVLSAGSNDVPPSKASGDESARGIRAAEARDMPGSEAASIFPQHADGSKSTDGNQYYRTIARLGVQVARALAYAHDQDVLHRDVKPSNLLLDARGHVWLTDFGLAKLQNEDNLSITGTGDFVGTLRYTSPEQLRGWADPRSDVYSLGVTLYELLSLRPAFVDTDRTQLLTKVARESPLGLRRVVPQIPVDLATIVHKAIRKEPEGRYESAHALADDLERFLDYKPIEARPITLWQRTRLWAVRNPLVAALASLLALAMALGMVGVSAYAMQSREAKHKAERAAQRSQRILDTLIQSLRSPDPTQDGREVLMVDVLQQAAQRVEAELTDEPIAQADLLTALGATFQSLGIFDQGIRAHTQALALRQQELGDEHPDTLSSMANLAAVHYQSGNLDQAKPLFEQTASQRRKILGAQHPDTLKSMNDLAIGCARSGAWGQAISIYEETLAIMQRELGPRHLDTLKCLANLGGACVNHNEVERGLGLLEQALEASRDELGSQHPTTMNTMVNLAQAYHDNDRPEESHQLLVEALDLHREVLGDEHPRTQAILQWSNTDKTEPVD